MEEKNNNIDLRALTVLKNFQDLNNPIKHNNSKEKKITPSDTPSSVKINTNKTPLRTSKTLQLQKTSEIDSPEKSDVYGTPDYSADIDVIHNDVSYIVNLFLDKNNNLQKVKEFRNLYGHISKIYSGYIYLLLLMKEFNISFNIFIYLNLPYDSLNNNLSKEKIEKQNNIISKRNNIILTLFIMAQKLINQDIIIEDLPKFKESDFEFLHIVLVHFKNLLLDGRYKISYEVEILILTLLGHKNIAESVLLKYNSYFKQLLKKISIDEVKSNDFYKNFLNVTLQKEKFNNLTNEEILFYRKIINSIAKRDFYYGLIFIITIKENALLAAEGRIWKTIGSVMNLNNVYRLWLIYSKTIREIADSKVDGIEKIENMKIKKTLHLEYSKKLDKILDEEYEFDLNSELKDQFYSKYKKIVFIKHELFKEINLPLVRTFPDLLLIFFKFNLKKLVMFFLCRVRSRKKENDINETTYLLPRSTTRLKSYNEDLFFKREKTQKCKLSTDIFEICLLFDEDISINIIDDCITNDNVKTWYVHFCLLKKFFKLTRILLKFKKCRKEITDFQSFGSVDHSILYNEIKALQKKKNYDIFNINNKEDVNIIDFIRGEKNTEASFYDKNFGQFTNSLQNTNTLNNLNINLKKINNINKERGKRYSAAFSSGTNSKNLYLNPISPKLINSNRNNVKCDMDESRIKTDETIKSNYQGNSSHCILLSQNERSNSVFSILNRARLSKIGNKNSKNNLTNSEFNIDKHSVENKTSQSKFSNWKDSATFLDREIKKDENYIDEIVEEKTDVRDENNSLQFNDNSFVKQIMKNNLIKKIQLTPNSKKKNRRSSVDFKMNNKFKNLFIHQIKDNNLKEIQENSGDSDNNDEDEKEIHSDIGNYSAKPPVNTYEINEENEGSKNNEYNCVIDKNSQGGITLQTENKDSVNDINLVKYSNSNNTILQRIKLSEKSEGKKEFMDKRPIKRKFGSYFVLEKYEKDEAETNWKIKRIKTGKTKINIYMILIENIRSGQYLFDILSLLGIIPFEKFSNEMCEKICQYLNTYNSNEEAIISCSNPLLCLALAAELLFKLGKTYSKIQFKMVSVAKSLLYLAFHLQTSLTNEETIIFYLRTQTDINGRSALEIYAENKFFDVLEDPNVGSIIGQLWNGSSEHEINIFNFSRLTRILKANIFENQYESLIGQKTDSFFSFQFYRYANNCSERNLYESVSTMGITLLYQYVVYAYVTFTKENDHHPKTHHYYKVQQVTNIFMMLSLVNDLFSKIFLKLTGRKVKLDKVKLIVDVVLFIFIIINFFDLPEKFYPVDNDAEWNIQLDGIVYSVLLLMAWMKVFLVLMITKLYGPFIRVMFSIFWHVVSFFIVVICITFLCAQCFCLYFRNSDEKYKLFFESFITLFNTAWGQVDFTFTDLDIFGEICLIGFTTLSNIMLFNLIVAIVNNLFDSYHEKAEAESRAKIVLAHERKKWDDRYGLLILFPAPINIFSLVLIPYLLFSRLSGNSVKIKKYNILFSKFCYFFIAAFIFISLNILNFLIFPFTYIKSIIHYFHDIYMSNKEDSLKDIFTTIFFRPFELLIYCFDDNILYWKLVFKEIEKNNTENENENDDVISNDSSIMIFRKILLDSKHKGHHSKISVKQAYTKLNLNKIESMSRTETTSLKSRQKKETNIQQDELLKNILCTLKLEDGKIKKIHENKKIKKFNNITVVSKSEQKEKKAVNFNERLLLCDNNNNKENKELSQISQNQNKSELNLVQESPKSPTKNKNKENNKDSVVSYIKSKLNTTPIYSKKYDIKTKKSQLREQLKIYLRSLIDKFADPEGMIDIERTLNLLPERVVYDDEFINYLKHFNVRNLINGIRKYYFNLDQDNSNYSFDRINLMVYKLMLKMKMIYNFLPYSIKQRIKNESIKNELDKKYEKNAEIFQKYEDIDIMSEYDDEGKYILDENLTNDNSFISLSIQDNDSSDKGAIVLSSTEEEYDLSD